jgi:UTP--glucose-1-phosphate uridylyltransferase
MRKNSPTISHAVIPIAGLGTRLAPLTKAVPKALLPLVDGAGRIRPVLHWIIEEALSAGLAEITVVLSPRQRAMVERYVEAAAAIDELCGLNLRLVEQAVPGGLGDAMLQAREAIAGRPFLLMLGDHVYQSSRPDRSCAAQVLDAFETVDTPAAVVGVQAVGAEELERVGAYAAQPLPSGPYRAVRFIEKPTPAQAADLRTHGLAAGKYLAHCGLYAMRQEILDCLDELASERGGGELALADAQSMLLDRRGGSYLLWRIEGAALDTGTPETYARTLRLFALKTAD